MDPPTKERLLGEDPSVGGNQGGQYGYAVPQPGGMMMQQPVAGYALPYGYYPDQNGNSIPYAQPVAMDAAGNPIGPAAVAGGGPTPQYYYPVQPPSSAAAAVGFGQQAYAIGQQQMPPPGYGFGGGAAPLAIPVPLATPAVCAHDHHHHHHQEPPKQQKQKKKEERPGLRWYVFPLLLSHNLLHYAVLALSITFVVRVQDLVNPLCDPNDCGFMGCDFIDAKCSTKGKQLTHGLIADEFGDDECCAFPQDIPLISESKTAWAVGISGTVIGWVAAVLGPLIFMCFVKCGQSSFSNHGGDPPNPLSMRLPVVGAAYTYSRLEDEHERRVAEEARRRQEGHDHHHADDDHDNTMPSYARAGSEKYKWRTLSVYSSLALFDSLVRDVLLLAAGLLWSTKAETVFASSTIGAGYTNASFQWKSIVAFGTYLFAAAAASLGVNMALRSHAVMQRKG